MYASIFAMRLLALFKEKHQYFAFVQQAQRHRTYELHPRREILANDWGQESTSLSNGIVYTQMG